MKLSIRVRHYLIGAAGMLLAATGAYGQNLSLSPSSQNLFATGTQQFTALYGGQQTSNVTWSISPSTEGTISTSGLYTAPADIPRQTTVNVTAVLNSNTNVSATATITLGPLSMSISPSSQNLNACQTQQFTATIYHNPNTAVTWSINPSVGSINTSGVYTAPASISTQQTVTITATSVADTTKSVSSPVTLYTSTGNCGAVSVTISPTSATLYASQTQSFTATVSNTSNTAVTWSISPSSAGSINSSGLYTAPSSITSTQTVTVTATSQADTTKSATATVTLSPPITVSVAPTAATLYGGQPQQFNATVSNSSNGAVTWSISPSGSGSINASGLYTAPATISSTSTVIVTAASQANTFVTATATITLEPPLTITVTPSTALLSPGQTQQFAATVSNATNTAVTWSISPSTAGSINSSGLYTAPSTISNVQTVTVTATSQVNSSVAASATITLSAVSVTVAPTTASLYGGQTQQFSATVSNATNTGVTWTISPSSSGSISSGGLYTAPTTITAQSTVTVTATSQADTTKSSTATITLYPPVSVTVAPTTVTLYGGQTQQFTATVTNPSNGGVTWTISPSGTGSINASGLYTAPATISASSTVTVTATSQVNNSVTATATITLEPPATVTVAPSVVTLYGGQTQQFSATVTNATNQSVTWTISPTNSGSINASGLYTAPATISSTSTVTVTATSQANNSVAGTATITLEPPLTITVAPTTAELAPTQTQQFNATVTNATNLAVTWSISPSTAGSISSSGLYTAPSTIANVQTVTVTATSQAVSNVTATATITLSGVTVTATPTTASLSAGQTQQFTATVNGSSNSAVTWTISPATGAGTISTSGLYTAPPCVNSQQTVTITATSQADTTKSITMTVTLLYASGYSYKRAIVINHNNVPNTDQANFPVLINSTDPTLASVANGGHVANANGYDLTFTSDSNCFSNLPFEVENWNPLTGQLIAWVQVPLVSHTTDTPIYMCYGNSSITASQSNHSGVWDSNYQAVWHLPNGVTLTANDSTVNADNGTLNGAPTAAAGQIDGAASLNGSSQFISTATQLTGPTVFTESVWFKTTTTSGGKIIGFGNVQCCGTSGSYDRHIYMENNGALVFGVYVNGTQTVTSPSGYNDGAWHYVVGTLSSNGQALFVDGFPVGSNTNTSAQSYAGYWRIGYDNLGSWPSAPSSYYFGGVVDEVRVSNSARSADWITTEFNNQSSPQSFYTLYPENSAISVDPLVSYVYGGQSQQLSAIANSCSSSAVTWSMPSGSPGTLTSAGLYTAPTTVSSTQAITITATSQADGKTTSTGTINLLPPIQITVSPTTVLMTDGLTHQFAATVTNAVNTAVTWSISPSGSTSGTLSATGLYTAPATVTTTQTVAITATSVAVPTASASAVVTLIAQVSPPTFSLPAGTYVGSQQVTISTPTPYASIRYTTDGSTPSETAGILYTGPITVSSKITVNAIAYVYGEADSTVSSISYTFATATSSAQFIDADTATQGSWIGVYGSNGYYIPGLVDHNYPAYVTPNVDGNNYEVVQDGSTYYPRALQKPAPALDRYAAQANANACCFTWDMNFTDGQTHQIAIYFLDWNNSGDAIGVTIRDAATQAILDTRTAQSFYNGEYLVWTVSGHVDVGFQNVSSNGPAYFSGWFFDPPTVTVSPRTTTLSPNQTQQFTATVATSSNQGVNWSINPAGAGSITASGLYTAPNNIAAEQNVMINAASQANPANVGTATVTLSPGTSDGLTQALALIAKGLCRDAHVAPSITAGPDQQVYMSGSSATANLAGTVTSYMLNPGDSLTYAWAVVSGPGTAQFSSQNALSTTATFTVVGYYTMQLTVSDGVVSSTSQMHVTVAAAPVGNGNSFVISPSSNGPFAVGTEVKLNMQVYGYFAGNGSIQLTITGANPQTATIYTDGNGVGGYAYIASNTGVDTISGTAVGSCCTGTIQSNVVTVTWTTAPSKLTSSPVTAQFFVADGSGVFNTPSTATPAFTQVFPNINFNATTTGVTNQTRPFTDVVTDQSGNILGTIVAQGVDYQAGVGPMYAFSGVFTGVLNVPSAGQVTFNFTGDDAFIFGVGNNASRVSGPQLNTPATTPFQGYAVMGGVNEREATNSNAIVVNFPAAGSYPYEVDYAKGGDNHLTLTMLSGGYPIPAAALLTLSPSTQAPIQAGGIVQMTLAAKTADGIALGNLPVTISVTGQNAQSRVVTTDGTGQAQFAYAGEPILTGIDTVQAVANVSGVNAFSNAVTVNWNNGMNQAPVVSAGSAQTITLPSEAVLAGSVYDDGLPSNTLAITWSKVSGPGTVTFDDPNQAATAATFSTAGTYVLQLSAYDGALTTNSTVTITVNTATTWNTGWIANPLENATVNGVVPVTLVSGITLTSGTLTFYPANNQTAITTINATATGTGQIGTFDTTLLTNGQYFIQLSATNSLGVTQTNLVLVTVAGQYKPGRVTATITDLTVPAPGLPIQIQRTYDSLVRSASGDFGYGWNLGVNIQTSISLSGDVTLTLNGQTRTFYFTPQPNAVFVNYYQPQYTAEPGFYGSLVNTGDNCSGVLVPSGNLYQCAINNAGNSYQPTGFQYTDPYGRVYTMAASGNLQSVKDLSGNTLTIAATGISSTNGLNVPFVRDTSGRITQITDTLGNQYLYSYDSNGNLATVTYPGVPTPAEYQYDSTHLLTSETDMRGNPAGSTTYFANGQLQSVTDAMGNVTQFAYNTATNTTTVTNPDGGVQTTVYDFYGMPLSVTDPLGRVTTNTYDANHNLLTMTDPLGKTTTYTYNSNGFRTSTKDPLGDTTSAVYNAVGGPTQITDPLSNQQNVTYDSSFRISNITDSIGQIGAFTYNTAGLPLTVVDPRGNTSTYTYDQYGNRTSYTDPLLRKTTSVYDTQGNLSSQTDPRTNTTSYAYDSLNRKISMTDALNNVTKYAYDGNNNKISETDANNNKTSYAYDALNRVSQITYPDNTTVSYTYDFRNNKLTETDQLGRVTNYVYDLAGQLTRKTVASGTPDAATTSYTYDLDGRKLTETDPNGNATTRGYDAAGRYTSLTDAVGNVTQYGYDAKSQRTSMIDAKQRMTTYTYDVRGHQLVTTTPDTKTVTKTYDGLGYVLTVTDEENRTTTYNYDAASQLSSLKDGLNQLTQYTYDPAGNKLTQEDANTHTTSYAWDNVNRRTSRTLPAGQSESYTYDPVGNKKTRTDFNGKTTTFAYDTLNRLLSRTPDPSFNASPITFTYTNTGKRATMTDPSGTTTYSYTNRDQVSSKATPEGTLAYTYDKFGHPLSVVSSNANGTNVAYAWDADERLQSVTDNGTSGVTTYTYDQTNQLSTMTYPNGVSHAFQYDLRDRAIQLNVNGPSAAITSYQQTFSPSGRKLSAAEMNGRTANYGYDAIYRLLTEGISSDPTASNNGMLTYVLDPVGNRQSLTSTLAALGSESLSYDADDRLTTDTYDANGNTLGSGGTTYTYDFEDRLVSTSTGVQIVYDGDGNRASETANGTTTKYLVDELTPTGYAQVAEELVSSAVSAQFTHGLMRISQNRAGTVSYYGYDAGGSTRELVNGSGTVTDTYDYDAFGNIVAQSGTTVNGFLYRGEYFDSNLNFYYLRSRWYKLRIGRFVSADKYEGVSIHPDSLHPYLFAGGDPINFIDPTGRDAIVDISTVGKVIALGLAAVTFVGSIIEPIECLKDYLESVTKSDSPELKPSTNPADCGGHSHKEPPEPLEPPRPYWPKNPGYFPPQDPEPLLE